MALLSWMPRVRSLYSRYFSTMGASSLWALAVFWKRAESETISGEARALLSSSYFSSVWSRRSNMGSNMCRVHNSRKDYCTGTPIRFRHLSVVITNGLQAVRDLLFPLAMMPSAKQQIPRFAPNDKDANPIESCLLYTS